jgi:hypothetical protein
MKKQDILKNLHNNDMYKKSLELAKDQNERDLISKTSENFILSIVESILNVTKNNPNINEQLVEELTGVFSGSI